MKKKLNAILDSGWFWGIIVGLVFCFLFAHWCDAGAQGMVRKGNVFIQQSNPSKKIEKDTNVVFSGYYYEINGNKYPIYVSSKKRCFIIRISKTGKKRRQYLPEISEQLYPTSAVGK